MTANELKPGYRPKTLAEAAKQIRANLVDIDAKDGNWMYTPWRPTLERWAELMERATPAQNVILYMIDKLSGSNNDKELLQAFCDRLGLLDGSSQP